MTRKIRILQVIAMAIILLIVTIAVKFKPAYAVSLAGKQIGFVNNKDEFQSKIENEILNVDEDNVAFVALDNVSYDFQFVSRSNVNEDETFDILKGNSSKIYRVYEIADNNSDNIVYVNTLDEAENLVEGLKQDYSEIEPDLKITTLYLEEEVSEESIQEAKNKITEEMNAKLQEKQEKDKRTVNGIYLACIPVSNGTISSRYGSRESIRNHAHAGLDIAARYGTEIKAAADGTIKYAGWMSGYGNLVIISHGNGVETYYGHCSSLTTSVGKSVTAGDVIAKVGSTGNSTGNHLHFEIRINGSTVNPQKYIY